MKLAPALQAVMSLSSVIFFKQSARLRIRPHRRRQGLAACAGCLALFSTAVSFPAKADEVGDEIGRAFGTDSTVTLHLRTFYFDRKNPGGRENEAWAGGGWLGYQSGWLADFFRAGFVVYTSQPLYAPENKDGTLLLEPHQDGFTVLGQAYGSLKLWDQVFTGFRQSVDQPEVNPRDNRMVPQTFQGYTLTGKIWDVEYFGGFLDKMKERNADGFRNFARVAGAPSGVSEEMWLGGLAYSPIQDLKFRVSAYEVPNILTSTYVDGTWLIPITGDLKFRPSAQYMYQSSNGDDLLTGRGFNTWVGGVLGNLIYGPVTLTAGYTQVGENANYRHPFGSYAAYSAMIIKDYDRAEEKAWLLGGSYDFASLKLPGLSFTAMAAFGSDAKNPTTRAAVSDDNEYDFTLDYRFTAPQWPDWAKPLWIRLRAAFLEDKFRNDTDVTKDYRVIINYEKAFK